MLLELPTAEEIDGLAVSTPRFEVRKLEFDLIRRKADLNYTPCKGQVVLVIRGKKGTPFVKRKGSEGWSLPSNTIPTYEDPAISAKRVAKEQCGLMLRSLDLAGMYDVVFHYLDVSIKRLHLVYAAVTDDLECQPQKGGPVTEAAFFVDPPESARKSRIDKFAIADCSEK
jgi:ADP-ribose pyrophosphatase YjhB (NUDIX family)